MQLAIFLVLVLIAILIAPWLFGVVVAAIAAFGIYWVVACGLAFVVALVFGLIQASRDGYIGRRKRRKLDALVGESNRRYREKEALGSDVVDVTGIDVPEDFKERANTDRTVMCKGCGASIVKYSLFCPVCGKDPRKG